MELYLEKTIHGFSPADEHAKENMAKFKLGTMVRCKITRKNNAAFHRKMMALFNVGFEYWVPGEIDCKYGKPEKNFDRFRKDMTILAGYYEIHHRIDGTFRVEAKSLSFDSMEPEEREDLFSNLINVLLKNIFQGYEYSDVAEIIEQRILDFA